ncbi:MAG: hypothetical protein ABJB61_13085 [bacterium]
MSETEDKLAIVNPLVHLVATNPTQMEGAKENLRAFLIQKIEALDVDIVEFNQTITAARDNKFSAAGLTRLRSKAVDTQEFYAKILEAVEAGYTIIPDFPIDVFAIRVGRERPENAETSNRYGRAAVYLETPDVLSRGEGDYVSSVPLVKRREETKTETSGTTINNYTVRYADPTKFQGVAFPVRAARAELMDATNKAMQRKIFDQFGICPPKKNPDPLIIGQVLSKKTGYSQKSVSFLIAWHLNLGEL